MTVDDTQPENHIPDIVGGLDASISSIVATKIIDEPILLEAIRIEVTPENITPTGIVTPIISPTQTIGEVVGVHIVVQVEVTLVVIGRTIVKGAAKNHSRLCSIQGNTGGGFVHLIKLGAGGQGEESKNRYDKLFHIRFSLLD